MAFLFSVSNNKVVFDLKKAVFICYMIFVFSIACEMILRIDLPGGGKLSLSRMTGFLCLLLFSVDFVLRSFSVVKNKVFYFWVFGFVFSILFSSVFVGEMDAVKIITYLSNVLLVIVGFQYFNKPSDLNYLFGAYFLGAFVTASGNVLGFHFFPELLTEDSGYGRTSAFGFDKNDMALIVSIGIVFLSILLKERLKIVFYLVFSLFFYSIFLTASKTGFVLMCLTLVVTSIKYTGRHWYIVPVAFFMSSGLLATIISSGFLPEYSLERFSTILVSVESGDLTGREIIWERGWSYMFDNVFNFLFGGGVGMFVDYVDTGLGMNPHNVFLSVFFDGGIIGLLLISYFFIKMTILFLGLGGGYLLLLANISIAMMMLNWEISKTLWFFILITMVHIGKQVDAGRGGYENRLCH